MPDNVADAWAQTLARSVSFAHWILWCLINARPQVRRISEVVEAEIAQVFGLDGNHRRAVHPAGFDPSQLAGLQSEWELVHFWRARGELHLVVKRGVDVQVNQDTRVEKAKGCRLRVPLSGTQRERAHAASRSVHLPLTFAPIDHTGGILSPQPDIGADMRIIEIHDQRNRRRGGTLDIDIPCAIMPYAKHMGRIVKTITFLLQSAAAGQIAATR